MTQIDLGTCTTPEEAAAAIQGAVLSFLRAGGAFSWADWAGMSATTRLAAEAAGVVYARERARMAAEELTLVQLEQEKTARAEQLFDEVQGVLG